MTICFLSNLLIKTEKVKYVWMFAFSFSPFFFSFFNFYIWWSCYLDKKESKSRPDLTWLRFRNWWPEKKKFSLTSLILRGYIKKPAKKKYIKVFKKYLKYPKSRFYKKKIKKKNHKKFKKCSTDWFYFISDLWLMLFKKIKFPSVD